MQQPALSCVESRVENDKSLYGRFLFGPLLIGQGITIGNALRRSLLAEIPGVAITTVEIDGVTHEYSTIRGVQQSVLDILLNIKQVILTSTSELQEPAIGFLHIYGPGLVLAKHIKLPSSIQCINPDQFIAGLSFDGVLQIKFFICKGKNYKSLVPYTFFENLGRQPEQILKKKLKHKLTLTSKTPLSQKSLLQRKVEDIKKIVHTKKILYTLKHRKIITGFFFPSENFISRPFEPELSRSKVLKKTQSNKIKNKVLDTFLPYIPIVYNKKPFSTQQKRGFLNKPYSFFHKQTKNNLSSKAWSTAYADNSSGESFDLHGSQTDRDTSTIKYFSRNKQIERNVIEKSKATTLSQNKKKLKPLNYPITKKFFSVAQAAQKVSTISEAKFKNSTRTNQSKTFSSLPEKKALKEDINTNLSKLKIKKEKRVLLSINPNFAPVKKVNFVVETDDELKESRDRILLEVWTNGSLLPREAIQYATNSFLNLFTPLLFQFLLSPTQRIFYDTSKSIQDKVQNISRIAKQKQLSFLDIENLELSLRTYTCLKQAKIETIGNIAKMSSKDLRFIQNFNQRCLEELQRALNIIDSSFV